MEAHEFFYKKKNFKNEKKEMDGVLPFSAIFLCDERRNAVLIIIEDFDG